MPVSFPVPMGSRCNIEVFNFEKTNPVENKRRSPLNFKSNGFDHVSGNKGELRNSDWTRISLIIEVNGEGKRRVAWKKGGLMSSTSIWVSRGQKEHVVGPSGSWVHTLPVVGSNQQVGLLVIPFPKPIGPSRLVVDDNTGVVGYHVEVSPAPSEKASTARQLASLTAMNSVGQT
nr:hypothetical protein CFP56_21375 [Quercus suber]